MSNLNTGATESGKRSWFILLGGRGPALAELAKMMSLQSGMVNQFASQEIPESRPETRASVVIPEDGLKGKARAKSEARGEAAAPEKSRKK
jgi:hypothetical protein